MPPERRAVVIPFGVPAEASGVGLGLAALVHTHATAFGHPIGLAQLFQHTAGEEANEDPTAPPSAGGRGAASAVEGLLTPPTWRRLVDAGDAPHRVSVVVTGFVEPPNAEEIGALRVVAFDAESGETRGRVDVPLDGESAGRTIVAALRDVWKPLDGEIHAIDALAALPWSCLSSVLLAERSALRDPQRGGLPHDPYAALAHLERALDEPLATRFVSLRIAALGEDAAAHPAADQRWLSATVRSLVRVRTEAAGFEAGRPEGRAPVARMLEAEAAVRLRLGEFVEAEACVLSALRDNPTHGRLYALLSEGRRRRGDLEGAWGALESAQSSPVDRRVDLERGRVAALRGDTTAARAFWIGVLEATSPGAPPDPLGDAAAFVDLAESALSSRDADLASRLVDRALAAVATGFVTNAPEVLSRAVALSLTLDPPGLASIARTRTLARALHTVVPGDHATSLVLADAHTALGETDDAVAVLRRLAQAASGTPWGAIALERRFAIEHPGVLAEIHSAVAAAEGLRLPEMELVLLRVRRLALEHDTWRAWCAVGDLERKIGRPHDAKAAYAAGIAQAKGAPQLHRGMAAAAATLREHEVALSHAEMLVALDPSPAHHALLVDALAAANRRDDAARALDRARALYPADRALRLHGFDASSAARPHTGTRSRFGDTLRGIFGLRRA